MTYDKNNTSAPIRDIVLRIRIAISLVPLIILVLTLAFLDMADFSNPGVAGLWIIVGLVNVLLTWIGAGQMLEAVSMLKPRAGLIIAGVYTCAFVGLLVMINRYCFCVV